MSSGYPLPYHYYNIVCPSLGDNQCLQVDPSTSVVTIEPIQSGSSNQIWKFYQIYTNDWYMLSLADDNFLGKPSSTYSDNELVVTDSSECSDTDGADWNFKQHTSDSSLFKLYCTDSNYMITGGKPSTKENCYLHHESQDHQYFKFVAVPKPPSSNGKTQERLDERLAKKKKLAA